ncbi:type II toxin-antitoxin system PemK/MazF family toxin [Herbaspirillum sp. 1130]|uniref:type II toxin-antitoxin system PemK/MazF family toxin n=1 Tax=Herbaspirillum sp. 1130 TaxID=2806562 RepID=UPI001AE61BE4|nr:type II toxin-antitoxin system PemK/MazF family toxin [Herbaspirillum sp. 1130]
MIRGDFVNIAIPGDIDKLRPALVIQANQFGDHASVTVLPITGRLAAAPLLRVTVQPNTENGLHKASQVMVDKAVTLAREKVGETFGRIDPDALVEVERCLAVFLGIVK